MSNKSKLAKMLLALGVVSTGVGALASCGGSNENNDNSNTNTTNKTNANNETRPFTMASQEVDQVFSPFYSSSTADSSVVSMTQISMLGNDKNGNPKTRKQGASVVTDDYQIVYDSTTNTSTYYFVLNNSIKFSNGSALTIKDVLFNMYVYLDPTYNGSSTMYSTDIVGLNAYRYQTDDEDEQNSYMDGYNASADARIEDLITAFNEIIDNWDDDEGDITKDAFKDKLQAYAEENELPNLVSDFDEADKLFKEEVESDYQTANSASATDYEDQFLDENGEIVYFDANGKPVGAGDSYKKEYKSYPFSTVSEFYLYNNGYIKWNKKEMKFEFTSHQSLDEIKKLSKEDCISLIYNAYMPTQLDSVVSAWQTASNLKTKIANDLAKAAIDQAGGKKFQNISGIKFANKDEAVSVNGITYAKAAYNSDGSASNNEVLSITINGQDPKAIWNFSFAVAPMYYYSSAEEIAKFDYVSNFGVSYNDQNFRDNVLKDSTKIKLPVGAGAYKASASDGGEARVGYFYDGTTIYFERNEYFRDGEYNEPAKIKYVYFRVTPTESVLSSLYSGSVDYCEPSAKVETVNELNGKKSEGYDSIENKTQGYGYVGLNASKVKSIFVRRAIMHSINVDTISSYYGTSASTIYRSMSSESWAYPKNATAYYPYIGGAIPADLSKVYPAYAQYVQSKGWTAGYIMSETEQIEYIQYLITDLGGIQLSGGKYSDLSYTFTIAGASEDHPAYNAFVAARTLLNKAGLSITVKKDSQALVKLTSGQLEVWAAAWSSSLDPDMYQVYHKDSKATAILNWGYNAIYSDTTTYATEKSIIDSLSKKIMSGRKTTDQEERKSIYSDCLDMVMELAVELPTYQRTDLSAFNSKAVDGSTFVTGEELTSLTGVTSKLWRTSLVA